MKAEARVGPYWDRVNAILPPACTCDPICTWTPLLDHFAGIHRDPTLDDLVHWPGCPLKEEAAELREESKA